MSGKQILLDALQRKATERTPWLPFVGSHGGQLIGKNATDYLRSADHIVAGLLKAKQRYQPDGLPIVFDLQVEAEVLGCKLVWAEDGPPAVASHPLSEDAGGELADLPAFNLQAGRIPTCLEATRRIAEAIGDDTALYGLICGPFTLALHLMGNDIFLEMFDDEERVQAIIDHAATIGSQMATAYIEAGCDVVAVVDPMVSQISPEHFEQFVTAPVNHIFDTVHAQGKLGSMFVCGDATRVLDNLAGTTCDNFSIDENIDLAYARQLAEKHGCSIGGNIKLTLALLLGTPDDVRRDVVTCLNQGGDTGFILAPGCDLPYATPSANLEAVAPLIHDNYQLEVARSLQAVPMEGFDDIQPPNYNDEEQVIIDLITLDSKTCPPCQYMVAAANRVAASFDNKVIVREHKVTGRDGIGYMVKLGVGHVPTLCIDGQVAFSSLIPDARTLEERVNAAIQAKVAV